MAKFIKIFSFSLSFILISIAGLITYIKVALPNIGEPDQSMKIEMSKENIERGRYLANHVTVCMDCHSTRNWNKYSGPLVNGTLGKGGEAFTQDFGFPGEYHSKNITPYNLKDWTDGEIYRCITTGVNKHNKALFPVMPYPSYGKMSDSDIKAIIAYIRTLNPIESSPKESKSDFPMNLIINTIPVKASPENIPDKKDTVKYGSYLINAAGCAECHTKSDKGKKLPGMDYAGGFEFKMYSGITRSSNITPDKETGIGNMTKDNFIEKFKKFDPQIYTPVDVKKSDFNTVMPWMMYSGMTKEDLGAIYDYLLTVKPVKNKVEMLTPNK